MFSSDWSEVRIPVVVDVVVGGGAVVVVANAAVGAVDMKPRHSPILKTGTLK